VRINDATLKALQSSSPDEALALLGLTVQSAIAMDTEYNRALQEFNGIPRRATDTLGEVTEAVSAVAAFREPSPAASKGGRLPFIESPTGKILYENGAIYDPETERTLYPPDSRAQVSIQGSNAWLRDIQERWSQEKVEAWRKRLWAQGYTGGTATGVILLQSETGGWGVDLVNALREYHADRYANYGKAIPLTPSIPDSGARSIRRTFDKRALKEETKTWGLEAFGEDLDDNEAEFFADRILDVAQRLAKKHGKEWSVDQIQQGAALRVQEQFVKDPAVADALEEMEELEGDTTIRNSLISISQLGQI
jgi:hypothetical protein